MSSRPETGSRADEKRNVWSYAFKLTLTYSVIFAAGMLVLGAVLWDQIQDRFQEDWAIDYAEVNRCWGEEAGLDDNALRAAVLHVEGRARVHLGPDQARMFDVTTVGITFAMVLLAALCGAWLTRRAVRPIVRLTDTLNEILETGSVERRVPPGRSGPLVHDIIVLFNSMLARIEGLVRGMHDALDNVAHDLRTPLTRLRAVAEDALQDTPDLERQREALSDCMEESEQVLTMLTTLMDVAEAETGAMRLRKETVDVSALAGGVAELYELVAGEKDISVRTEVPETFDVRADPGRLRQVLANLVDNAVKYTRAGGQVAIGARIEGDDAVIEVIDDGMGIAPGDVPRIFDRLYRGDRSRAERGLGLGLSFVRAIVEAHGGTVSVSSVVNRGSTFTVRLPIGR